MDIKKLYDAVDTPDNNTNPFVTEQTQSAFDVICDQYPVSDEIQDKMIELVDVERRNAFAVGFHTATQLLINGGAV